MSPTTTDPLTTAIGGSDPRREAPFGRPRAESFVDPVREHRWLVETVGILDDTDRALLRMTGPRSRRMLNGLITADLTPLDAGRVVYGFVLTARGRPVTDLRVLPWVDSALLLDVPAAGLEGLEAHLGRYLPPIHARAERDDGLARLAVVGPRAAGVLENSLGPLRREGAPVGAAELEALEVGIATAPAASDREGIGTGPEEPGRGSAGAGGPTDRVVVARREPIRGPGFDLYGTRHRLADAWDRLLAAARAEEGGPAGRAAYRVWRVERGLPAYGEDVTEENLPQETGQEGRAISFEKGCYTGQEVVARIHYRGHVNRRLMGLRLPEGPERPGAWEGRELYRDDRPVARITSAVVSPRRGPIALGYVRREVEPGERLAPRPGGAPEVEIVTLPFVTS